MKITRRTAIGVTLIVLIGLTSWALAGTLTEQQYIDAGKAEFPKGNYETAIYLFTAGLQLNPDNPGLYNDRGLCYLKEGDIEMAIADLSKAIELNPDFAEAYYNRGLAYFGGGKWMRALDDEAGNNATADFTKAIELDPEYIDAYYTRGIVYSEFLHYYRKPFSPDVIDKYHKAVADFDKVLELDPTYVLAYAGKGNLYYRYGEFDNSTVEFNKALESEDPIIEKVGEKGLAAVYYSRGRNYGACKDMVSSTLDYEKAIELDPTLMTALGHVTGNYQRLGEWNKLIENCDYMLDLKKDDPEWLTQSHGGYTKYAAKGVAYHNLMRQMANEAIFNYNKVIELKPSVGAYRNLGAVYRDIGESEKAKEAFEKALAIKPSVGAYRDLGAVYRDIGESEKAKEAFEKALEMDNTTIEEGTYKSMYSKYYSRGLTYYEMQEYNKAISDFNKAIELKSDYAEAYRDLGKAYVAIGDTANATEAFETAVRLFEEQGNPYIAEQVKQLLEELPTVGASALPKLIMECPAVLEDVCPMLEQGLEETAKEI